MPMKQRDFQLRQIGIIRSDLKALHQCRPQEKEGHAKACIEIAPEYAEALHGLEPGGEILVLTWLHLAERFRLKVHPRGNPENPMRGVFATRSPHRPNPIGLHRTRILSIQWPCRLFVQPLEVIDNTPVVDIKSLLPGDHF
ncbi:MAG: tRNA (N6-threonylcarbamoyladenosine(37)-N6)-methyltransferase TrmO [Desulfococcus sp. 4484_242]|nr:MAG: tRNA (N6-threonylcarbamoyladenosine(37)-N6)-methyltransferase TrmO [Desulfococcus sp. 4484_242]